MDRFGEWKNMQIFYSYIMLLCYTQKVGFLEFLLPSTIIRIGRIGYQPKIKQRMLYKNELLTLHLQINNYIFVTVSKSRDNFKHSKTN